MKTEKLKFTKRIGGGLFALILTLLIICGLAPAKTYAGTVIKTIEVYDLDMPVIGETPDYDVTLPDNAPYCLATQDVLETYYYDVTKFENSVSWFDEGRQMSPDERFVAGRKYTFLIIVIPKSDYKFSSSTVCSINNCIDLATQINNYYTYAAFTSIKLTAKEATEINSVDVYDMIPEAGEEPNYDPYIPEDAHYHIASQEELEDYKYPTSELYTDGTYWFDVNKQRSMKSDETFGGGNQYWFATVLIPDYGYRFADDPIFTIDDSTRLVSDSSRSWGSSLRLVSIPFELKLEATESVSVKLSAYNAVKATWSPVSGATGYKVYYRKASGIESYKGSTEGTSMILTKLPAGAKCSVKVVPFCETDDKTIKAPATTSSTIYTLKKLSTPKVSKNSSGKVTVRWTNIPGETGYQISQSKSKTKTGTITTVKTKTGKSKVIKAPKKANRYYKVRAYATVGGKKIYAPWSPVKKYKLK